MKKIYLVLFSIVLLSGGFSSCSKTNKEKISNDWKVTSFESTLTSILGNHTSSVTNDYSDGHTYKTVITSMPFPLVSSPDITTIIKNINIDDFTINKDGTWEWTRQFSSSDGDSIVTKEIETQITSGTWNFLTKSKTEEIKKNEKVLFNILKEEMITKRFQTVAATGHTVTLDENEQTNTYLMGVNALVYTVVESKSKELRLSAESHRTSKEMFGEQTKTILGSQRLTLTKK